MSTHPTHSPAAARGATGVIPAFVALADRFRGRLGHVRGAVDSSLLTRIAARFEAHARAAAIDRILAASPSGTVRMGAEHHSHLSFAARLALTFAIAADESRSSTTASSVVHTSHTKDQHELRTTNRLIDRVVTRGERVNTLVPSSQIAAESPDRVLVASKIGPAPAAMSMASTAGRVERVLSASPRTPQPGHMSTGAPSAPPGLSVPTPAAAAFGRNIAASAVDVEQIAERVVRVIDRRLTASRERFGRV